MTRPGDASAVIVFHLLGEARPVFHELGGARGRSRTDDGWWRNEARTRCGLVHWAEEWMDCSDGPSRTRNSIDRAWYIRRDHARLIGRPCRRCEALSP